MFCRAGIPDIIAIILPLYQMDEQTKLLYTIPVLPSADIARDLKWYDEKVGFACAFNHDNRYASMVREHLELHLQWHAGTDEDPLLGGSVVKFFVKNIKAFFGELIKRGTVAEGELRMHTAGGTHEFGFYDLNNNAVFFVEDV